MGTPRRLALTAAAAGALLCAIPPARAAQLRVGVGRADITPLTGGFKGGWACSCAKIEGQHTRLFARAIVLERDGRKLALVAEDLAMLGEGMVRDAAALLADRGFAEQNIVDSATHTHGSQVGYMNFPAYNSVLPNDRNLTQSNAVDTAADPVLYSFMVRRLATAIRRADDNLGPGTAGWGAASLLGVTQNRSLEARLADFGIVEPPGSGNVGQAPGGYPDTIDPAVDVLRVDKLLRVPAGCRQTPRHHHRGRHARRHRTRCRAVMRPVPVGIWSAFANHGTVVKPGFPYFSADHQGAAERIAEAAIRAAGGAPAGQDVVDAFANSDGGDMTAGIAHSGPADAEWVGAQEAAATLGAWRVARNALSGDVPLDVRWTRMCFCGQNATDTTPVIGQGAGAGSEELRTIFYDHGLAHEGDMLPFDAGPQGDKVPTVRESGSVPAAVPVSVVRIANGLLAAIPGEATVGVGRLVRAALEPLGAAAGIGHVAIAGYADDYISYVATPAEYERQHYEGGFTLYGEYESLALTDALAELGRRLLSGAVAPAPQPSDPNHGVHASAAGYGDGAGSATATDQPAGVARLGHAAFSWQGAGAGIDRPLDRAFVTIENRSAAGWRPVTDDLGLQIVWSADSAGSYRASWEVPLEAGAGEYRFHVTGRRYELTSRPFAVGASRALVVRTAGGAVVLGYPGAAENADWTYRPPSAGSGAVTFVVDGRTVVEPLSSGAGVPVPAGAHVAVAAGGARDAYGNANGNALEIR